ncbi:T9SS type A sorting domain-containing protein [Dyadobacter sp. NIV53]|uniref:T9SS type A sorting domain-containing protein n=1 Tax=Dyadobacter sp. NIV53 TaxID=2861765 RepID=UPI001C86B589|nr:T9SS type A sorting domain-containing protein [Dyadobacter sp. NIV53]
MGPTIVPPITLNDNPTQTPLVDIGASQSGRLWAVGSTNNTLYYRDLETAAWIATSVTNVSHVDGGPGNTCFAVTTAGLVIAFDGTTVTQLSTSNASYGGNNAFDIGSAWDSRPYITTAAGTAPARTIWRYSGSGTVWALVESTPTTNNLQIDGNPSTGGAVVVKSTNVVSSITSAGVATNLAKPASSTMALGDIAVSGTGRIFLSSASTVTPGNNKYIFEWTSGTTWATPELLSRGYADRITVGIADQIWGVGLSQPTAANVYTRVFDGTTISWLNDERVHTSPTNSNSEMIAVAPGTYTVTETLPGGWDLQSIYMYDPTSNSSIDVVNNKAMFNVAAGEIVHAIFENGLIVSTAMTNSCTSAYLETFGTGPVDTYGPELIGQTDYHYGTTTSVGSFTDYYKVIGNSKNLFNGTSFFDHTVGDGQGRMMAVDGNDEPDVFFRRRFTDLIPGQKYDFSAWAASIGSGATKPNIAFLVIDPATNTVLGNNSTGPIDYIAAAPWQKFTLSFVATTTIVDLVLQNNANGGNGNDLAVDDISFAISPAAIPITTVVNATCGTSTGSITVTSPVGSSFEYSQDGFATLPQSSPLFSSLTPGIFTISARYVGTTDCLSSKTDTVKVTICGSVFDDANGDAINNSENPITTGVWVNLVDPATNAVLQSVLVDGSGNYNFGGLLPSTDYKIILTETDQSANTNLTVSDLPGTYVNTGTNLNGTVITANQTGVITVNTGTTGLTAQNFGIEQPPVAVDVASATQPNPGGSGKVVVPTLNGTDPEDGTYNGTSLTNTIKIQVLPTDGTLYYNGVAVTAGQVIPTYNPALLTLDPNDGVTSVTFTYSEVDAANQVSPPATVTMPFTTATAFACSSNAYQVAGNAGGSSTLYSYNVNTGVRTSIAVYATPISLNNLGYNIADNMIWGFNQDPAKRQVVRLDAAGVMTSFTIPNLPTNVVFNVGDVMTGGYLFLYINGGTRYYVVDINPAHANYLQLVDPTAAYIVDLAPFGNAVSPIALADMTYDPTTNLLYGVVSPTATNAFKIASLNPVTGTVTYSATAITGSTIQTETNAFGSVFNDINNNVFYAFANALGKYYRIDLATNTATLLSSSASANNNDGASCPTAVLSYAISGNVFNDANGLNPTPTNTVDGLGTNAGGLNAILYDISTGRVAAITPVNADGTYSFGATPGDNYSVYITTNTATVGQTAVPVVALPLGWVNTAENLGATAGHELVTDGILSIGVVSASVIDANFGIEQPPVTNNDSSLDNVSGTPVTINPLTNDTDGTPGTLDGATVSLVAPVTATGVVTDANGDITSMTIPGEGTWTVNPTTGAITFTPLLTFTGNPTVINYNVEDNAGKVSNDATVTITYLALVSISGNVWNDVNGDAVNSTENPITAGVWVNLVDPATNDVIQSVQVDGSGNYTFPGVAQSTSYQIILTNADATGNTNLTASTLPGTYVNTGTNLAGTASTANTTGVITVNSGTTGLTAQNFGIEIPPVATNDNSLGNVNGTPVTINPLTNDMDTAPGTLDATKVSLVAPVTATGVVIDANGDVTSMTISGEGTWTVNPTTGAITFTPLVTFTGNPTVISYNVEDNASKVSNNATVAITYLSLVSISGSVWDDADGDITVNGTEAGTDAGSATLTAYLVNSSGNVVSSSDIDANGVYTFTDAFQNTAYTVVLSNTAGVTPGSPAPAPSLPNANWVNTGESFGSGNAAGSGVEANTPGVIAVTTSTGNITAANFGIEQLPASDNKTGTLATQPTSNQFVTLDGSLATVPPLTGSDPEDQPTSGNLAGKTIAITSLPTNGELWYNGELLTDASPATPLVIPDFDPSQLQIKLTGTGYTSTSFTYAYVDAAGQIDKTPATYTLNWASPLPVTLASFTAVKEGMSATLKWTTTEEVNSDYFEIQQSTNGKSWNVLSQVESHKDSKQLNTYTYTHKSPAAGTNYYRLKMVDQASDRLNATYAYSTIRQVTFEPAAKLEIYPNPANVQVQVPGHEGESVKVYDGAGILRLTTVVSNGQINTQNLSNGLYLIKVATKEQGTMTAKFVIVK